MKRIGKSDKVTAPNALGRDTTCTHTDYQVEQVDVGRTREHYLGYNHRSYQFTSQDVGKVIDVMTDGTGWTCWSFGSQWGTKPVPTPAAEEPAPAPSRPRFERLVVPVLSTNHISEDADRWLQTWDGRRGPIILAPYDAGYFFRVLLDHEDVELIPQSIREVAEWAAAKGYDWVRIDSTVPTIDDLTSYVW